MCSIKKVFTEKLISSHKLKKPILIGLLLNGNAVGNSSVIVRKELIEKVGYIDENKNLIACEDYNTWLKISTETDKFLYFSKRFGYYSFSYKSISSKNISKCYTYKIF